MFNGTLHNRFFSKLVEVELAGRTKDVLVVTDSRDVAEEIRDNMIAEIESYGHVVSRRLVDSISAVRSGDEYEVKGIDYAKYVNGYDRETFGPQSGFVDRAVRDTRRNNPNDYILKLV
jgi:hypothetical protein